jgi:hypothetical protein
MTQDEVATAIRQFIEEHRLVRPLVVKRKTPTGWFTVLTLPTDDAHKVIRPASKWAIALGDALEYGDARYFGDWEIQEYTAQGPIGEGITARIRVVGILGRIDRPVTAHDIEEAQEFEAEEIAA